ncbi:hypothetical protein P167DRAFT_609376 [Morchella conica CCBAS932]|uniref:UBA domain-containing protein n=1 Tax=Morchella conica CCBAS932 TaxID=1392247 RepID=A0A3N4KPA2_9PEZI|nr:hypothetical protein P167DRAFT_609376 [Morchella conica CCBAS932]
MKMNEIGVDENKIEALVQLGLPRDAAVQSLKSCNGQLERAAEYYYGGDYQKAQDSVKWSEEVWAAPREGPTGPALPPEFRIQSLDVLPPSVFEPDSRPPSRISNRKPIDLTDGDENDPELARALAASLQESSGDHSGGYFSQQESGITHTSPTNPNFGRAPPEREYEPNQWALTTTQTHEIFLDPFPADRKRIQGDPSFLRPDKSGGNLAALITILHAIPGAREALLFRTLVSPDYGHDDQWWNGQTIRKLRIVNVDEHLEAFAPEEIVEAQRLMAFLDQTTRAYGSVEGLSSLQSIQNDPHSGNSLQSSTITEKISVYSSSDRLLVAGIIAAFFDAWRIATDKVVYDLGENVHFVNPFVSTATQRPREASISEVEPQISHQKFGDLTLISYAEDATLYDAIDRVVWILDDNDVFVEFSDVLCISIKPDINDIPRIGCRLDIPMTFYPDRYTEDWIEPVREIRKQIEEKRALIVDIEIKEEKLRNFRSKKIGGRNPTYDPKILLESVIEHLSTPQPPTPSPADDGHEDVPTESQKDKPELQQDADIQSQMGDSLYSQDRDQDTVHMLKSILSQLEKKLDDLSVKKEEAHKEFKKLKDLLTSPETSDPNLPALTKYSLRGFSTEPTVVYVLIPDDTIGVSIDGASSSSANTSGEQWWCIHWGTTSNSGWDDTPTASYEVKKVALEEVQSAMKNTGDGSLLLVYANDNALIPPDGVHMFLPTALQTFVERDNAAFKAELQPTSPGKKRHSDWLEDEDEAVDMNSFLSKKASSSRSSVTLENEAPATRRNSLEGAEMEMTEGVDPTATLGETMITHLPDGNFINTSELAPPPRQEEMTERGHISPVAKAFHLDKNRERDIEMMDVEHVENAGTELEDLAKT